MPSEITIIFITYNRSVELRHLRYFVAVAENAGFGRTARILHVAQSAISEQVRDLETELGVSLFDRGNRQVRLTWHGEQFLEDARLVLASADKAVANVRRSIKGEVGTLTIGFFVGGTSTFFPGMIWEFRLRFPDVHVSLVELAPAMQYRALQTGSINVGFTRPVASLPMTVVRSEHFQTEALYAVLPKNHRLAQKLKILISELSEDPFVLNDRKYSPAVFDKVIMLCADAGFSPKIGATASVSSGVIALVEAGEGVAILPIGSRIFSTDEVIFVPLADQDASVELVIAWSPLHENPVLHTFLEMARKKREKPKTDL